MVATAKEKKAKIDPFNIYVGRRLTEARIGGGESREQLAGRWGITFQQIQKYEKGLDKLSHRRIYDASKFYDKPLSFFTDGYTEKEQRLWHHFLRQICAKNADRTAWRNFLIS